LLGECLPSGYVTWILTEQNAEKVSAVNLLFADGISALPLNHQLLGLAHIEAVTSILPLTELCQPPRTLRD